ncbi:MAG: RNA polymerase sigma factor [Candidatus Moranbacteria bacterium]|nr:RNA polymerase sigma factor [Candidatus Moranbacteria bacterium]
MIIEMDQSDENLIEDYVGGDDASFKLIIDRYTPIVFGYVSRFVGKDNADDLTQNVFIKVWKNIRNFDDEKASFKTWLFKIARNTTIDYLRKKKSINFSSLDSDEEDFASGLEDDHDNQEDILIKSENINALKEAIKILPLNYREILVLYYEQDMTFKEIGELLNKPLNTVKSYHRRALIRLKKELS